jgi:hypothetical protein
MTRTMLGSMHLASSDDGVFDVDFWQVNEDGGIGGAGFTVRGQKITEFLTRSETNALAVWAADDTTHVVHDLCVRGLKVDAEETAAFLAKWRACFEVYQRSRRATPPRSGAKRTLRDLIPELEEVEPVAPAEWPEERREPE